MQPYGFYQALSKHFPKQKWWKGGKFEIIIGAILTQNTSWNNVEIALENLKKADMLNIEKLANTDLNSIKKLIKPAGFYSQKSKYIRTISKHLLDNFGGNLNKFFNRPVWRIREELLSLNGIGNETADSILLYAGNKPVFVVDAYTKRISHRMGMTKEKKYSELQKVFESNIPHDMKLFKEFHALIVEHAKKYCKKNPECKICPVAGGCKSRKI